MYHFGIVECTISHEILYYYVYQESECLKGRNNIFSCMVENFKEVGYFYYPWMVEVNIYLDNWRGQKIELLYGLSFGLPVMDFSKNSSSFYVQGDKIFLQTVYSIY